MIDNATKAAISEIGDAFQSALTPEVFENARKQLTKIMESLAGDFEGLVLNDLISNFESRLQDLVSRCFNAILAGDEEALRCYLQCAENTWTGRDGNHPIIHRKLFETGAIALRKQIVDAYPELLKSERILDLESQLAAVVKENNKLEQRWIDQHRDMQ